MPTKPDKIIEETKNQIRKLIIGFVQGKTVDTEYIDNLILRLNSDFEQAIKKLEQEKDKEIIRLKDNIKGFSGVYSVCCGERIELKEEIKELKKYTNQCNLDEFRTKQIKELKTKLKEKEDE